MNFKLVFGLFLIFFQHAHAAYTMADLEALEEDKNFSEFFAHAKDVRPSLRGKTWKAMVSSMADAYVETLLRSKTISEEDFKRLNEISRWAPLKEDEFFGQKRNTAAIGYFSECLKKSGPKCIPAMETFFKNFENDKLLGFNLAKAADSLELNDKTAKLWPFLAPMAKDAYGEFYCDKSPLYEAVMTKTEDPDYKSFIHKDCLQSAVKTAKGNIQNSKDVGIRALAFSGLRRLGRLSQKEKDEQALFAALSGFMREGSSWSEAYEAIQRLGEKPDIRDDIMKRFHAMETLPDYLFSKDKSKQALALTKQLGKNFPEFLNLYTEKCLKWLKGETDFPQGNPTPNCHSYFSMSKIINSSPSSVVKNYEKLMNSWKN